MKITDMHIAASALTQEVFVVTVDKRRKVEKGFVAAQAQERTAEFLHALIALSPFGETNIFEFEGGTAIRVTVEKVDTEDGAEQRR